MRLPHQGSTKNIVWASKLTHRPRIDALPINAHNLSGIGGIIMKYAFAVGAVALTLTGCASVTRGTTEDVVVKSLPEDATIRTSLGQSCPMSPCTVQVSRKSKFMAFAEKPGYKPGQMFIDTKMGGGGAAGLAGNILIGGIIGIGVDAATGATLDHFPNPALIVLEPIDPKDPKTPVFVAPPPPVKAKPAGETRFIDP
jgi:hypothetical protein